MKIRAAVLEEFGQPLVVQEVDLAEPNDREVLVRSSSVVVLNESAPLPFQIDEHVDVGEEARLKYRYLDLRRPGPAKALRLRSQVNRAGSAMFSTGTASLRSRHPR